MPRDYNFLGLRRHKPERLGFVHRGHERRFAPDLETPRRHWRELPASVSMQEANLL
jgi:hypothetical protein